ncbi:MAG: lysophospholipid acyltransferase family protein [Longimicrobiales bacterium]
MGFALAGVAGAAIVRTLFATTRVERVHHERLEHFRRRGEPVIFVFWHGHLLPLVHYHRREGIVVLVSEHSDGEYIAQILHRCGFGTARGSSTRGGARGLRELVRAARAGKDLAVTPDGPRGPRHEVKVGALAAAQMTGLPLVPMAVSASSAWTLASWDRFLIPKPFSTVRIEYLPPRFVPRDASREQLEALAAGLASDLGMGAA